MGSGSRSAGDPEYSSGQGRHRRGGTGAESTAESTAWTPPITPTSGRAPAHARPTPSGAASHARPSPSGAPAHGPDDPALSGDLLAEPRSADRDPLTDTGPVVGLRAFNLGSIPASVTPPPTWRRAAWFTIGSSAAALIGLLFMTVSLVAPASFTGQLGLMPDLPAGPTMADLTSDQPTPTTTADQRRSDDVPDQVLADGRTPGYTAPAGPAGGSGPVTTGAPVVGTTPDAAAPTSGGSATSGPVASPPPEVPSTPVTSVTGSGPPVTSPGTLASRTQEFFADVTSNVSAAANLTSGTVRDDAAAIINQKYGQVETIQVQSIALNPNSGVTVSLLRVVDKDGSTTTQQTTLQFTLGNDPKIENPGG